jgi:outer membrane protein, adhesin transport system
MLSLLAVRMMAVAGLEAEAASVAETVQLAVDYSPRMEQARSNRSAIREELTGARAGYRPTLDFRASTGPEYLDTPVTRDRYADGSDTDERFRIEGQLTLSQMLFDGFETQSEVERQRARLHGAAHRVRETAEFVGIDAVEAHLEVMRNTELVRLNEIHLEAHQRIFDQVRRLANSGAIGIADVRQSEARLANALDTLITARGSHANAIAIYESLVGEVPVDLSLEPPPVPALPASRGAAARLAAAASPTVLSAAAEVQASLAALQGSRASDYPRLDLELNADGGRNVGSESDRDARASAYLVLRYNLYRGGADAAREREAFFRSSEARATLAEARRLAEEDATIAYNAYETARARTTATRARAEAQRRTRDAYLGEFEIGQRQLLDVLDAENELFLARASLTTAEYTEAFAVYRVLASVGRLLDTLSVARTEPEMTGPWWEEERAGAGMPAVTAQ